MALMVSEKWKIVCDHCVRLRGYRPISQFPGNSATMADGQQLQERAIQKGWRVMNDSTWLCPDCKGHAVSTGSLDLVECPFANLTPPTPEERIASLRLELVFWENAYTQFWGDVCDLPLHILEAYDFKDIFDFDDFTDRMFRKGTRIKDITADDIDEAIAIAIAKAKRAKELEGKGM